MIFAFPAGSYASEQRPGVVERPVSPTIPAVSAHAKPSVVGCEHRAVTRVEEFNALGGVVCTWTWTVLSTGLYLFRSDRNGG